jgi:hypothetical protein
MRELNKKNNNLAIEAIDNAIYKLKIYMIKNNQNLHSLSNNMKFDYQPFYRLITKYTTPTLFSLGMIASHLNCTISELISDKFFLDINCYNSLPQNFDEDIQYKCRIYIPNDKYKDYTDETFFVLNTKLFEDNKSSENNLFYLFYKILNINTDGIFLVEHEGKIKIMNVVSISSKFIIIEEYNNEVKINLEELEPIAKLFDYVEINNKDNNKLFGRFEK